MVFIYLYLPQVCLYYDVCSSIEWEDLSTLMIGEDMPGKCTTCCPFQAEQIDDEKIIWKKYPDPQHSKSLGVQRKNCWNFKRIKLINNRYSSFNRSNSTRAKVQVEDYL